MTAYNGQPKAAAEHREQLLSHMNLIVGLFANMFGYIKTFEPSVSDDHPENYYMEREWRVIGKVHFQLSDVMEIVLPEQFVAPLHRDVPEFRGSLIAL
jgi:hypothetical protein